MLPPIVYGVEKGPRPDYRQWINALSLTVRAGSIDRPESMALLAERGITHVFVGQLRGRVNYNGGDIIVRSSWRQTRTLKPFIMRTGSGSLKFSPESVFHDHTLAR